MESLTAKDFIKKLKANDLKPAFMLKSLVKKSDKDSEVLFAQKPNFSHWVKLPVTLIESVEVIKTVNHGDPSSVFAKIYFITPSNAETKALLELLTGYVHEGLSCQYCNQENQCGKEKEMFCKCNMFPMNVSFRHFKSGLYHAGCNCPCCNSHCSCCGQSGCVNPEHGYNHVKSGHECR